ncbi:hypothetical protein [Streptomyces syringium]
MSVPVLGIVLISGAQVQIQLTPESLYAALAALTTAGGSHLMRRRHQS